MVDRGPQSMEIVTILCLMKLHCPESILMLKGNHETNAMNKKYGFEKEVLHKHDAEVLGKFRQLFGLLPVGIVIEDLRTIVMHGGIGRLTSSMSLAQINALDRTQDPPSKWIWPFHFMIKRFFFITIQYSSNLLIHKQPQQWPSSSGRTLGMT